MCDAAVRGIGLKASDIHGFIKRVPMADAEPVRLQQEEGYVHIQ